MIDAAKAVNEALNEAVKNGETVAKTLEKLAKLFSEDNISLTLE